MTMTQQDISILRNLANRVAELAGTPENQEKMDLWSRKTDLDTSVRPLVLTHLWSLAWSEVMPDAATLQCQDGLARSYEKDLRQRIWTVEHIDDDTVIEPVIGYPHGVSIERYEGLTEAELVYSDDDPTQAGAAKIQAGIVEKSDIEKLRDPVIRVNWEQREQNRQEAEEIFGSILDVIPAGLNFSAKVVDEWAALRGMDQLYLDLVEDPQWTHEALQRIADNFRKRFSTLEELGVWGIWNKSEPLGSNGLRFNPQIPSYKEIQRKGGTSLQEGWGSTCAEAFTCVSPKMHDEFAFHYDKQLMPLFKYVNVGCCEVLAAKVERMKKSIPNLRSISISEWNDVEKAANALGTEYVYGYKPSGVPFVGEHLNEDAVRTEIGGLLEKAGGCVLEIILNIGGCLGENAGSKLKRWADIAMEEVDKAQEKN